MLSLAAMGRHRRPVVRSHFLIYDATLQALKWLETFCELRLPLTLVESGGSLHMRLRVCSLQPAYPSG